MNELIKVREISLNYGISARALKYYEDVGLLTSTRNDDYAYRMYDEEAVKRLEQILVLRKLNISVKDIKRIFDTSGSEVVLDVLGKKVSDIDSEVALLHELKEIITDFINHIRQSDFSKDTDVKLLYEKAKEIEGQLINVDYNGNPGNSGTTKLNRLMEVTESLRKPPEVRIVKIKPFKAITTGLADFDTIFGKLMGPLQDAKKHLFIQPIIGNLEFFWVDCPHDFEFCPTCGENCQMKGQFIWAVEDGVTDAQAAPYELLDFQGGLYAVVMSVDEDEDMNHIVEEGICKWLETSGFELDKTSGRRRMSMMMNPSNEIKIALGYDQLDIYVPIKIRDNAADLKINPYPRINLWCQNDCQIVNLPDENHYNVMKVINPKSWAVVSHNLNEYKNQNVTISFSVEVKRVGAAGNLNWTINNDDYPCIGEGINNADEHVWHKMSGSWTGILSAEHPLLYLSTHENNSDKTIYYVSEFNINVVKNSDL